MKNTNAKLKKTLGIILSMSLLILVYACGSSKNNDGMAFSEEKGLYDTWDPTDAPTESGAEMELQMIEGDADDGFSNMNTEDYSSIIENAFLSPFNNPLSTFSIDVDAASYANVRRFLNQSQLPPKDAIRTEELVNYFHYDYPQPTQRQPFSVNTELSECPWNPAHRLVHIGLQGTKVPTENLPPSNLVFLMDVSGSMDEPNKLPLLKSAFHLLVEELRPQDHVSMVVYAGAAGVVLEPTSGDHKKEILAALEDLEAGGSTAGGEGIELAYALAEENFLPNGNNRVIMASDGDFNVGLSSDAQLERLIEEKREKGVFLTTLGFGMGNYKDNKMETLADKGNGNYSYIDNILEAKKVLVNEFGGTLFTIAKDVKIQVEFNPAQVKAYRLIGYENRMMAAEDFNDDTKDAGELGSGHTVTALYELIPASSSEEIADVDGLKYQKTKVTSSAKHTDEIMTVKLRYKEPKADESQLLVYEVDNDGTPLANSSNNFRWSAAVAEFCLLLRDSEHKGAANFVQVRELAKGAQGDDPDGYRNEFLQLTRLAEALSGGLAAND